MVRQLLMFSARAWAVMAIATALMCSCSKRQEYVKVEGAMLGTFLHISAQTNHKASDIYQKMMQIDKEAKASMSIFDENSLLSRINRNETDSLDSHIIFNLRLAESVSRLSQGSYDVTVKPLVEAHGFAGKQRKAEVNTDSIMEFVGYEKLSIIEGNRLRKADARMQIDFNSIAKGYTVDLAAEALEQMGIENYMVDIGGEVRCRGENPKGTAWRVGIETPIDGNNDVGAHIQQVISLSGCAMATSGNYRRYYIDSEGRKVAHTIDPTSGKSAITELLSATVIAPSCALADAYGTMFMAMGKERAIALAKELEREGVMVYFITAGEAEGFEVYYSRSLAPMLNTTEGYRPI